MTQYVFYQDSLLVSKKLYIDIFLHMGTTIV